MKLNKIRFGKSEKDRNTGEKRLMNPLNKRARQAGREAMEEKLTKAARVYRTFRQGLKVKRDEMLDPVQGLALVCSLRDRLNTAMKEADLDPKDCATAVVFAQRPELTSGFSVRVREGKEHEVLNQMVGCDALICGAVFALRDREKPQRYLWAYPFVTGPKSLELLNTALDSQGAEIFSN
jgi:hypothetical protein